MSLVSKYPKIQNGFEVEDNSKEDNSNLSLKIWEQKYS